jgi:hypothetical protein
MNAVAEALAGSYLVQYGISVVTVTVTIALAMSWVF